MRIRLLGVVEAITDAPVALGGVRLRGLLARLALDAGRPVGTDVLIDDLWGEAPPDGAANALQALVSRLRRAIGPGRVERAPRGYRLLVDPDDVDALRFTALLADAGLSDPITAAARLREALDLWPGPAVPPLSDVGELPFVPMAAARLAERRAAGVEDLARLGLRNGVVDLDQLTAQLDAQPLRESTAALLARGLQSRGRQAEALAVLDRTRDRLAQELGVDPGPEIVDARLAVLRGERAPTRERATAAASSFVGRDDDLARVRALLGTDRLVTLTGPGGAGKTRLADEATSERARVLAELAALTGGEQLPAALLAAAGGAGLVAHVPDGTDTADRLVAALDQGDVVLVLDNCEHLVGSVAVLTETLLRRLPRLRVLATSREPLGVPGEVLHPVGALADADAVALFVERGSAVSPGFDADSPAVAEICRRLDGQPLPIELAAARLRALSPAEIAARLDDRFRLLTAGARTALPRHQTLRAVVDWSWDLLDEPERAVARRLGAFAGGTTLTAAERVCSAPAGPAPHQVFDLLAALVDKSLVVAVPQPDGRATRYRMLETIRAYAIERLDEAGERADAAAAHAQVVLELAETAEPHLRGGDQLVWLARLREEAAEIDIVLRRAVAAGDADVAHRLVAAMTWSWVVRGLMDEAARWVETVYPLRPGAPPDAVALNTAFLAVVTVVRDRVAAQRYLDEALAIAADLPLPRHPVLTLLGPVSALFVQRDHEPIRRLIRDADDPWTRGFAMQVSAQVAENDGDVDEQHRLVRAAHALFVEAGDRFGLGMTVHALGELEDVAGHREAAAAAYDEAIALAIELGNAEDLPQFLSRRAMLHARHGDHDAARRLLRRASTSPGAARPEGFEAAIALTFAQVERMAGDLVAARAHLDIADVGFPDGFGVPQRRAWLATIRADVELAAQDLPAAWSHLVEAIAAAEESKDGPVSAAVAETAARVALAEGDAERAGLLLGVAAAQRGVVDRGNPEVTAAHDAVVAALGVAGAEQAVRSGRALPRSDGLGSLAPGAAVTGG